MIFNSGGYIMKITITFNADSATVHQDSTTLCAATDAPSIVWQVRKAPFASISAPALFRQDSTALISMAISDDLHTLSKAWREAFEVVDRQPIDADLHRIFEELEKLLYTIHFDKEGRNTTSTAPSWTSLTTPCNLYHCYPIQHTHQSTKNRSPTL